MQAIADYRVTHPFITFKVPGNYNPLSYKVGEAFSKCQHLMGTPLPPMLAARLGQLYLIRGAQATAAIEGNTLTESQVADIAEKRADIPQSQEYMKQEIENILAVLTLIYDEVAAGQQWRLTPEWLKAVNYQLLDKIDCEDHVIPGEYTTDQLTVGQGTYRPVDPREVPVLVEQLCEWLNSMIEFSQDETKPDDERFLQAFYAAVLSHLYVAWIHPFGDGNGRTARALEAAILAHTGLAPWVSCALLSDHYNRTRTRYYQRLARASRHGEIVDFMQYAAQGLVDLLREQIREVQSVQRDTAWVNYVHETFQSETQGETTKRRRALVLALTGRGQVKRSDLRRLNVDLAEMYAAKGDRTLSHDLNRLVDLGLVSGDRRLGYRARIELIDAFLPKVGTARFVMPPETQS
jgi:Fic family protein